MINTCPENRNVNEKTKDLCKGSGTSFSNIPVSCNNTVYKNVYCARCNDISLKDLEIWYPTYLCRKNIQVTNVTKDTMSLIGKQCTYYYIDVPPKYLLQPDCDDVMTCNMKHKRMDRTSKACHSYSAPVNFYNTMIKNVHCAMCRNLPLDRLSCKYTHRNPTPGAPISNVFVVHLPNFDSLFDFIDDGEANQHGGQNRPILRPVPGGPRPNPMMPPKGPQPSQPKVNERFPPENVIIRAIFTHDYNVSLHIEGNWRENFTRSLQQGNKNIANIVEINDSCPLNMVLQEQIVRNDPSFFKHKDTCLWLTFDKVSVSSDYYLQLFMTLKHVMKLIFGSIRAFSESRVFLQNYDNMTDEMECLFGTKSVMNIDMSDFSRNSTLRSKLKDSLFDSRIHFVYELRLGKNRSDNEVNVNFDMISFISCKGEPENCSEVYFSKEYYVVINNYTVLLNENHQFINKSFYRQYDDGIVTCIEYLSEYLQKPPLVPSLTVPNLKGIISLVCTCLSLFSLVITLITYCILSRLRTLPGKCVMCLVVALFVAQLTFEVSYLPGRIPLLCLIISVVQHYSWLASFAWMNVLSYNVCKSFATLKQIESKSDRNSAFARYSLFAWLSPLVFIAPCLTFHFIDSIGMGYMTTGYCWLMRGKSVIYFFAVPVGLVMILNLGMFIRSAVAIHVNLKSSQLVRETGLTRELGVLVRVATLMGITWIFGYVSQLHDVLAIIFIILNGSQGFLIFILFVPQPIIKSTIRSKFNRKINSPKKSQVLETTIPRISENTL